MQGRGLIGAIWREVPGLVRLALPIVIGLAASTLIGVTDSVMLAPLGPVPLAAVGLTGAVAVLFYAAIYGLLSALSVRIGAAWGAGSGLAIPGILRSGLALGLLVGMGSALLMAALTSCADCSTGRYNQDGAGGACTDCGVGKSNPSTGSTW